MNDPCYAKGKINQTPYQAITISFPTVNLVFARTENAFLGCGVFDMQAFEHLGIAAAKVTDVKDTNDLFNKKVVECNALAEVCGVKPGMRGGEAILKMAGE